MCIYVYNNVISIKIIEFIELNNQFFYYMFETVIINLFTFQTPNFSKNIFNDI